VSPKPSLRRVSYERGPGAVGGGAVNDKRWRIGIGVGTRQSQEKKSNFFSHIKVVILNASRH
jgi:hypothetical protein